VKYEPFDAASQLDYTLHNAGDWEPVPGGFAPSPLSNDMAF
jgi:hypothetical protein